MTSLAGSSPEPVSPPREVGIVPIPTPYGEFTTRAFQTANGHIYLALCRGNLGDGAPVLTRLHSECLTGDALGSLRCDCGVQLRAALRAVNAEGRGLVLYLTGHEGRGVGLVNKLRAYMEQDLGADTLDANLRLGLPADARDYVQAGAVLSELGVRSVRLLTNNPTKAQGLRQAGVHIAELVPLATAAQVRNHRYLATKAARFGHLHPAGAEPAVVQAMPVDVNGLLGRIKTYGHRPYVMIKYAQTLDGRIATRTGDSKWISGEAERRVSHALRAACDAVLVGAGTASQDDPQLTVRLVPGATPIRVLLDSTLRIPPSANIFADDATTIVYTTTTADADQVASLRAANVAVRTVPAHPNGVDLPSVLADLRGSGIETLMVEGGRAVITSLIAAGLVDRLVASISPTIIGAGIAAVGDLGVTRIVDGVRLTNPCVLLVDGDVLIGADVPSPVE